MIHDIHDLTRQDLTLRDYFAAHASEDDIMRILQEARTRADIPVTGATAQNRADARYEWADKMLSARNAA